MGREKPKILFLQETKLVKWDGSMVKTIWGRNSYQNKVMASMRALEGLVVIWRDEFFDIEQNLESSKQFILLVGILK